MFKFYYRAHNQNRMKQEGDVESARKYFQRGENRILFHLVRQRFIWMNQYINESDKVCQDYIKNRSVLDIFVPWNICLRLFRGIGKTEVINENLATFFLKLIFTLP